MLLWERFDIAGEEGLEKALFEVFKGMRMRR